MGCRKFHEEPGGFVGEQIHKKGREGLGMSHGFTDKRYPKILCLIVREQKPFIKEIVPPRMTLGGITLPMK